MPAQGVQSVEVGARVLVALEHGRGPMALSEIATAAGMHPAKVHRYLTSLIRTGLASQSLDTGLYDLGPAARALGVEALRRTDPVSAASAHAVALRDQTGHTTNLAVWSDAGPMLVRWDTGAHALPIVIRVGSVLPLLDSAVGQVFHAFLPRETTAEVLRRQAEQATTRRLGAAAERELGERVRRDGLASTHDRMILGLAAFAAPVFAGDGSLEVVLGLILPGRLMRGEQARRLAAGLRERAAAVSAELGFGPA